jgi:mannose/fructose/N-acetylgalactosamine-specific phosphotransferase system component IIB
MTYQKYDDVPEGKIRQFVHSPFTVSIRHDLEVSCSRNGKITIKQLHENEEYEQVILSVSNVYRILSLVKDTRSVKYIDKGEMEESRKEKE